MSEHRGRSTRRGEEGYGAPQAEDWEENAYVQHTDEGPSPGDPRGDKNVSRVFRPSSLRQEQEPAPVEDFRDEDELSEESEEEGVEMSVAELLYNTSSFYAIVLPGRFRRPCF